MTCSECGSSFYPVTSAWGDRTCGDCIAARVALSLFPLALRGDRKPMRRAAETPAPQEIDTRKAG